LDRPQAVQATLLAGKCPLRRLWFWGEPETMMLATTPWRIHSTLGRGAYHHANASGVLKSWRVPPSCPARAIVRAIEISWGRQETLATNDLALLTAPGSGF
jgi:hypothetical protein